MRMVSSTGFACDDCNKTWAGKRQQSTVDGEELCPDCYEEPEDEGKDNFNSKSRDPRKWGAD